MNRQEVGLVMMEDGWRNMGGCGGWIMGDDWEVNKL